MSPFRPRADGRGRRSVRPDHLLDRRSKLGPPRDASTDHMHHLLGPIALKQAGRGPDPLTRGTHHRNRPRSVQIARELVDVVQTAPGICASSNWKSVRASTTSAPLPRICSTWRGASGRSSTP